MATFPWTFPVTFGAGPPPPEPPPAAQFWSSTPPNHKGLYGPQIVSLHTYNGIQLYQFRAETLTSLSWSREARQTSRCQLSVPALFADDGRLPIIQPCVHWISVWDETGQELYWRGPLQKPVFSRDSMTLTAKDPSELFKATRCPVTKRWEVTDPADIAGELVAAMVEHHGLNVKAQIRHDPFGDKFDYAAKADERMLNTVIDELVQKGLFWTFLAGVPLLGPQPHQAVTALHEGHFVGGGLTVTRDGSNSFNDVLLRSGTDVSRAKVPMAGLSRQTIVNADSTTGVSNTDRATKQAARYLARIRDSLALPDNAVLAPDAPVDFWQLVPSARINVEAFGELFQMELTGVDFSYTPGSVATSVRMDSVDDELPELIELQNKQSISAGGGV